MAIVSLVFILGKIYCTFLQMIFLESYNAGNWRAFLAVNSVPLLVCFVASFVFLRESPRYYFSRQQPELAFYEIERMGQFNNPNTFWLSDEEKSALLESQNEINKLLTDNVHISHLFSKQYVSFTIRIWIVFMLTSIVETTLYILMPFWLSDFDSKGFLFQLYMMLAELAAAIVVYFIIDSKQVGGRSKLVVIISLTMFLTCGLVSMYEYKALIYGLTFLSFLLKIMFTAEMVIMNESYTT